MPPENDSIIVKKLNELGMEPGIIYETIITSLSLDGNPHAAVMGIKLEKSGDSVLIKMKAYPSSKTGQNLSQNYLGVSNITDPELLIKVALNMCQEIEYVKSTCINVPRISSACAWIEFRVININKSDEAAEFTCQPLHVDYFRVKPKPYTRAIYALVEAAIHASRINPYKVMGHVDKVAELQDLIKMNLKIVEKVAPNSRYAVMADKIKRKYF